MKFTLKDYQDEAVLDVLENLQKAKKRWRHDGDRHAFSLTAPTGAGKTVMAAAAFEALFYGDDRYSFDRDSGAVVIWFSDDPSLNEQTRFRLMESSDRLRHTDLVVVEHPFNRFKLEAGKIYFLNTQKLGKKSLLTRGFDPQENENGFPEMRPDMQNQTIWDIIRNTVQDPELTLYLVLDEAHRGMGKDTGERTTIVKRLINGDGGVPAIPVVWGISATVERFNNAMEGAQGRSVLPHVSVDVARVQDSGLLKDTIVLDIPEEGSGDFDTVLVRRGVDKLKESSKEWDRYTSEQGISERVLPLMVLQSPNTPNPNDIGRALDTVFQRWPDLNETCVAHVFGDHKTQTFGKYSVPYIEPQRVQDDLRIRILIAKDAISLGWDCPRAEVMVSFRPASDQTYIAQLLGRMVRTPLARRIPGNDRLNSVDCLLPRFDKATVEKVVTALRDSSGGIPPTGRILINPSEIRPNPSAKENIWDKFISLASQTRPLPEAKPALRLTALAHELASDGFLADAGADAHAAMHKFLDQLINKQEKVFKEKRALVKTVEGRTIIADMKNGQISDRLFETPADIAVIDDAYKRSARILSPDIARTYTIERATRMSDAKEDLDNALIEAREDVAALHLLENLQLLYDAEATRLTNLWLSKYRVKIKQLPHERQAAYDQIVAQSTEPQDIDMAKPVVWREPTKVREINGVEREIPTLKHHLMCDDRGMYPVVLNTWEQRVVETECKKSGFKFWYRNPQTPSKESLGIAFKDGDSIKILRPDFIFFSEEKGEVVADIIDPHGTQLADALAKIRGLASYLETHPKVFRRVEVIAVVGGKMRVLDLTRKDVRQATQQATNAESLYTSSIAGDYL